MAETLDTLGAKIDALSASVDKRFEQVDKRIEDRFEAVAVQFAEQRAYTEFAYERLGKAMTGRFNVSSASWIRCSRSSPFRASGIVRSVHAYRSSRVPIVEDGGSSSS